MAIVNNQALDALNSPVKFLSFNQYLPLLLALFLIDFVFIALHFYNSIIPDEQWQSTLSIVSDDSYSESFQYVKWAFMSILLLLITVKTKFIGYLSWALVFLYLFMDDAFEIHEIWGGFLAQTFHFPSLLGLRPQDLGELGITAIAAAFLFSFVGMAFSKGQRHFQCTTVNLLFLIGLLAFFGVVVDMLHSILQVEGLLDFVFGVVEDGGEMFIASIMVWYVATLYKTETAPIPIHKYVINYLNERKGTKTP